MHLISLINSVNINLLLSLSLATLLMACDNKSNHETNYPVGSIVQLDEAQNINQSVDLILHYPDDKLSNISWQQTAGEPVTILADTSKVISFTPTLAGDYRFSVTFTLNNNLEQNLEKNIFVDDDVHKVTNRLSHAALAGNKVSFRTELQQTINVDTVVWQQVSGPSVSLTTQDATTSITKNGKLAIYFDAPKVNVDTIVAFSVTASDVNNSRTYDDQVAVLIAPAPSIASNAYFDERKAAVFPYNSDSPYAKDLVNCVYSNTLTSSCTLAQIPLLAKAVKLSPTIPSTPSVASIMDRVVVSHQWMGDRFKDFLTHDDNHNDIKNLLRATTAIVIAYDVRPSFYWAATGAIYLDPENFWLTPQERDTINEAPDYRANFGSDLRFTMPWRYVKNNTYASRSYSESARVTRTPADVLYRLTSLMYHELAHANDFFPSNEWYSHSDKKRVLEAATDTDFESDVLNVTLPLKSQEMRDLAQVSFAGESVNQTQKNYLPTDIEVFFVPDSASDFYAYSSLREDYAMLFEELMMQSRFEVIRDIAITNQPIGDNISAVDYIVTWGQRGRIGDNKVRDRVLFSASRVLPEFDSQAAMHLVPTPLLMIAGDNWLDNLTLSPSEPNSSNLMKQGSPFITPNIRRNNLSDFTLKQRVNNPINNLNRYYHKALPDH